MYSEADVENSDYATPEEMKIKPNNGQGPPPVPKLPPGNPSTSPSKGLPQLPQQVIYGSSTEPDYASSDFSQAQPNETYSVVNKKIGGEVMYTTVDHVAKSSGKRENSLILTPEVDYAEVQSNNPMYTTVEHVSSSKRPTSQAVIGEEVMYADITHSDAQLYADPINTMNMNTTA